MATTLFDQDGVSVRQEKQVLTITLNRGECRINPTTVALLSEALSIVEQAPAPKACIITGTGKFFCNGLDIEWMMANGAQSGAMIESFWKVLARLLVMNCHTVCAINGHGFGAGLFIALACDWRVMRNDKAWVNFPEVNLGMKLSKGFAELAKAKLSPSTLRLGALTGLRFTSADALAAGVIDAECTEDELLRKAQEMATGALPTTLKLARFNPANFTKMKIELYTDAYRALNADGKSADDPAARL